MICSCCCCCLVTKLCPTLFETLWIIAGQAPLPMGFSRQEYWSGLPFPPPGGLLDPVIKPASPVLAGGFFIMEPSGKPLILRMVILKKKKKKKKRQQRIACVTHFSDLRNDKLSSKFSNLLSKTLNHVLPSSCRRK